MDMVTFYSTLANLNAKRTVVFTSISSKDKAIALKLTKRIEALKLNHWCMYDEHGKDRNISGDRYPQVIKQNIDECCVFIWLVSKHSISSKEVRKELDLFFGNEGSKPKDRIIIPFLLNETEQKDIPEDVQELTGITSEVIVRRIDENTSDEVMISYAEEIRDQYITTILKNVETAFRQEKASDILTDLVTYCAGNKCSMRTVSEDIKSSNEISSERLTEMHVLSNEVLDYDCNTYSCMVIASNLLGNETIKDGRKVYSPLKEGVKYFYYYTDDFKTDCKNMVKKLEHFIKKDQVSRREVVSLICREFSLRNNIPNFFASMNGMTQKDFVLQYNLENQKDVDALNELFERDSSQYYFAYSDYDDVFTVPEEFFAYLNGDREKCAYDQMVSVSDDFIAFIGELVKIVENAENHSVVSFESIKRMHGYLLKLQKLEQWQMKKISLSVARSTQLVNYLLDYSAENKTGGDKKFPRLANWMEIEKDKEGNFIDLDEITVSKALQNLILVPIDNDEEKLKLCYSFGLFIGESGFSGAWYTTGEREVSGIMQDMVMTYDILGTEDPAYKPLIESFKYLIDINPQAKKILEKHNSELLD